MEKMVMTKSRQAFEEIGELCVDIANKKKCAIMAMIIDFEITFKVNNMEFEPLNETICGFVAISYINKRIAFVDVFGCLTYADSLNDSDFDWVFSIWKDFHYQNTIETE